MQRERRAAAADRDAGASGEVGEAGDHRIGEEQHEHRAWAHDPGVAQCAAVGTAAIGTGFKIPRTQGNSQ